jgi:hypothetical protein
MTAKKEKMPIAIVFPSEWYEEGVACFSQADIDSTIADFDEDVFYNSRGDSGWRLIDLRTGEISAPDVAPVVTRPRKVIGKVTACK